MKMERRTERESGDSKGRGGGRVLEKGGREKEDSGGMKERE